MNIEELTAMVESVLEMDEQADRSTALDIIRDEIQGMGAKIDNQLEEIDTLSETKDKLTARNNELFLRIDGLSPEEEEEELDVGTEIFEDESLFE